MDAACGIRGAAPVPPPQLTNADTGANPEAVETAAAAAAAAADVLSTSLFSARRIR